MKITKAVNHGRVRWRVNDPNGQDGRRQRMFFETKEAAEAYVKERTAETKAFGVHFRAIPEKDRAGLMFQLQRLDGLGWTLTSNSKPCLERELQLHSQMHLLCHGKAEFS
jgi:hypothetical protein